MNSYMWKKTKQKKEQQKSKQASKQTKNSTKNETKQKTKPKSNRFGLKKLTRVDILLNNNPTKSNG